MENEMNTAVEEKTPDQIEADMARTRESLTEKVAALENTVVDTVQNAAHTLTETVDAVKSFVTNAPEAVEEKVEQVASAVRESVKRTFDISSHIANNPWMCMGLSLGAGVAAGLVIFRDSAPMTRAMSETHAPLHPNPYSVGREPSAREPGFLDDMMNLLGRKLKEVAQTAIEAATSSFSQNVRDTVPKLINEATQWVATEAATKAEGFSNHHEAEHDEYKFRG